ncbi:pyrroloquinoline quinone-dependent dehydrogenase [Methylophaga muralis]|uniref:Quinohemoprotein ethanol dehydrogenase type-1 n=1 Tax=Methylophaga muralis TaxID=291169 RepID=A0A1E3GT31_9GAMM|nr:PQQ-binding-like beta-propeller repeat protein [Methylophaga muralis]ODN67210.1 Quinohemoprotein ethanol dehydrogenase type-1 precursor [Methylophaga muralis]
MRVKDFIWLSGLLTVISLPLSAAENDWPVYGGDNLHQRHSKLTQINKSNVTGLIEAWEFDTGVNDTFQATPVVQDGVMYVSLPFNDVIALDAATGKQLWRYQHDLDKDYPICCGSANRGVAVSNGMVFTGTIDARLIALDAKTGKKRWDHRVIGENTGISEDASKLEDTELGSVSGTSGAGINMAPMIYQDTVIIGITGVGYGLHLDAVDSDSPLGTVVGIAGKYGRRGFMAGYDIHTGEQKWQFDTIKSENWEGNFVTKTADGVELPRNITNEKAALQENADAWRYGGASAWSTPVIDPYTGILHFGTGNPSPQMEGSSRPGDNLYSSSLLALDASSGDYRWHYQQVPHDLWGYDVASPPVLFDITIRGQPVPAIGQAGKTGWFYVHDRRNGNFLYKSEAFVPQKNMFSLPSAEGTIIYPGVMGGANWSPVSVDARRRLVFIPGIHWPVEYKLHQQAASEGKDAVRYSSMSPINTPEKHGLLTAIDLDSGKIVWQVKTENPLIGGVLSTASGLVFTGEGSGELMAFDADSGEKRWSGKTDAGVNAPPITYRIDGKQYIAVAVGGNRLFGFKTGQKIKVWRLP